MSGAAIVRIPAPSGCARQAVDTALGQVPLVVLTERLLSQLEAECGSLEKAGRWLHKLVTRRRRPIGIYSEAAAQSMFIAPDGWSSERLQGYIAAHHEALEATCGRIERFRMPTAHNPGVRGGKDTNG